MVAYSSGLLLGRFGMAAPFGSSVRAKASQAADMGSAIRIRRRTTRQSTDNLNFNFVRDIATLRKRHRTVGVTEVNPPVPANSESRASETLRDSATQLTATAISAWIAASRSARQGPILPAMAA
jgi:hypothetical protein